MSSSSDRGYDSSAAYDPADDVAEAAGSASPASSSKGKAAVPPGPYNLRFQRRQSERAFVETQYRVTSPSMEYPSGASPWASSPEASRASFSNDVPREDLPAPAVQDRQHDDALPVQGSNGERSHASPYSYQPGLDTNWSPEQQQQHQEYNAAGDDNRRPQSGRYHNVPVQQPQQRQHMPQYKLQAKITGLERTGKKDLILRFDVYVSKPFHTLAIGSS
jgi:hypothetical protein